MRRSKRNLLNARSYIEYTLLIAEAYQKYGKCPAVDGEMAALRLFGEAIIRKHDERRGAGNRKDLYVGTR